jgi:DNA-binding GntR family transcriptional regulator
LTISQCGEYATHASTKRIPKRASLVAQVAEILRQELREGKWRDALPSESSLCDQLKVSRNTLRSALETLRRERLILKKA